MPKTPKKTEEEIFAFPDEPKEYCTSCKTKLINTEDTRSLGYCASCATVFLNTDGHPKQKEVEKWKRKQEKDRARKGN